MAEKKIERISNKIQLFIILGGFRVLNPFAAAWQNSLFFESQNFVILAIKYFKKSEIKKKAENQKICNLRRIYH